MVGKNKNWQSNNYKWWQIFTGSLLTLLKGIQWGPVGRCAIGLCQHSSEKHPLALAQGRNQPGNMYQRKGWTDNTLISTGMSMRETRPLNSVRTEKQTAPSMKSNAPMLFKFNLNSDMFFSKTFEIFSINLKTSEGFRTNKSPDFYQGEDPPGTL